MNSTQAVRQKHTCTVHFIPIDKKLKQKNKKNNIHNCVMRFKSGNPSRSLMSHKSTN